jgi:hypothetical protein
MPVIDADAHAVETEQTWEHMDRENLKFRPQMVEDPSGDGRTYCARTLCRDASR